MYSTQYSPKMHIYCNNLSNITMGIIAGITNRPMPRKTKPTIVT